MISLKEFIKITQGTMVAFPDTSRLKGECVTLVQEYLRLCYKIPFKTRGNAKDWINRCSDIADKVTKPEYGDIIVWGGNATSSGYGHVAIYIDSNRYYDQYNPSKKAGYASNSIRSSVKPVGYLRLRGTRPADETKPITNQFNLTRLLKTGVSGADVKELQKALGGLVIDGIYGIATLNKVKSYQKSKKLVQDGIVGKNTATALGWSYGKFNLTRLLKNGSKGNDVKELQKALGGLTVDGIFGKVTLNKVKAFQKSKKLTQDGIVGQRTAKALGWLYQGK